jgi:hypothetical protein
MLLPTSFALPGSPKCPTLAKVMTQFTSSIHARGIAEPSPGDIVKQYNEDVLVDGDWLGPCMGFHFATPVQPCKAGITGRTDCVVTEKAPEVTLYRLKKKCKIFHTKCPPVSRALLFGRFPGFARLSWQEERVADDESEALV